MEFVLLKLSLVSKEPQMYLNLSREDKILKMILLLFKFLDGTGIAFSFPAQTLFE